MSLIRRKFKVSLFVFFFTPSLFANALSDLPPPYDTAEILPYWDYGFNNGPILRSLIEKNRVNTIIEVGSLGGASTRHMAHCLPESGILYAVDHWRGSDENQPGQPGWFPQLGKLYEYFLSNTIRAGLVHKIVPVRMDSLEAASKLLVQADLIYIDASHDEESAYHDLVAWYPHLNKDGIFCGDDWSWGGVRDAVYRFTWERNLNIVTCGNLWMIANKRIIFDCTEH